MTRSDLNALADRVEESAASREIDEAVERATFNKAHGAWVARFSDRFSAAMSLTGWTLVHLSEIGADGLPMAVLTDGTREAKGYCFASPTSGESALARALTAAGLRALAMMQDDPAPTS